MSEQIPWYEEASMPALLRHARSTYGRAMRGALVEAGYDDIPANGLYVIGVLALGETPLSEIIEQLGVSKQAAGQLVDTLVLRGYLDRTVDELDRRRLSIGLTDRGRAAAEAQSTARRRIDTELTGCIGAEHVLHTRATLATLINLGRQPRQGSEVQAVLF